MAKQQSVLLPKTVIPTRYQLELRPDLSQFTFSGRESAFLTLTKSTTEIIFHSTEIDISSAVAIQDGQAFPAKIKYQPKAETVTFKFAQALQKGELELQLEFTGTLNDQLRGFYRSQYTQDGVAKYLATTQFESTDARRAFPCIDEPAAKAIFEISLVIPKGATAISNTLIDSTTDLEPGLQLVKFTPTPKMSTYLVAFLVGEFEWLEAKTSSGVLVRIFTTPGKKSQAKFALDVACRTLEFYNQYFDIAYPLPTMDMIAVPDFAAGAMENWGAVTYRETALLIDDKHSAAANRQRVAIVIAHELAHMWFGDLVTMEWWTHLWLNEGFASFMEYLAVDHLFPEWDMWTQFVEDDLGRAMQLDALKNTHPIEVEVHHPSEISEIFDAVSYSKGASVIRMLAEYLGPDNFRDGLRLYLKKHQYANARTEDLWSALAQVAKKPVAKLMKNWTAQPGYPLIEIAVKNQKLALMQRRFFSNTIVAQAARTSTLWQIPLSIVTAAGVTKPQVLTQKQTLIAQPKGEWFKLNPAEYGFYRVKYTPEQITALTQALTTNQLSPIDRLGLIRDAFDLSEAGQFETALALKLSSSYQSETDYTVWSQLCSALAKLENLLSGQPALLDFQAFGRNLLADIVSQVGWSKRPNESHTATLLRSLVLFYYGSYGDRSTIDQAKQLWQKFQTGNQAIDPDLRNVVYGLVAENGTASDYKIFKQLYLKESLQQERDRLARAMTRFKQPTLLQQTLDFAISKDVRNQDSIFIIAAVLHNPIGRPLAWQFITQNWQLLDARFGGGLMLLPRLIGVLEVMTTPTELKQIETFFKKHPTPEVARSLAQALEQIRSNIAWLKRDGKAISNFLNQ